MARYEIELSEEERIHLVEINVNTYREKICPETYQIQKKAKRAKPVKSPWRHIEQLEFKNHKKVFGKKEFLGTQYHYLVEMWESNPIGIEKQKFFKTGSMSVNRFENITFYLDYFMEIPE